MIKAEKKKNNELFLSLKHTECMLCIWHGSFNGSKWGQVAINLSFQTRKTGNEILGICVTDIVWPKDSPVSMREIKYI